MQRDFNLIRRILLDIEANPAGTTFHSNEIVYEEYDRATILEHVEILVEAQLICAKSWFPDPQTVAKIFIIERLTWQGHDFIASAKNNTIWGQTMALVREKGSSIPFAVLTGMLIKVAGSYFDLD